MTESDFEAITAMPAVKYGRVRIELQGLGFCLVSRRGDREIRKIISYVEACRAVGVVALFAMQIETMLKELENA